jgi:hypothetical protein
LRQKQRFSVVGGLNQNTSDADSNPLEYRLLENCYGDQRLGNLVKRRGSTTETITTSLGIPLGMGDHLGEASSSLLPVTRQSLVNFAGTYYKKAGDTWSQVTKDSAVSVSTTKPNTFAQIGGNIFIAGGTPARWDGSGNILRVGIPAPTSAPTLGSSLTGITGTFTYAITFYNSTTGQESDLSATAEITVSNKQVDLSGIPTTGAVTGVDKVRIYRTISNGSVFRLLTTINYGTSTATDTTADADLGAVHGTEGASGEYGLPPTNSYIVAAFKNHLWWVDAANPYRVYRSKPYIGNDVDLDYYPEDSYSEVDDPITGFLVTPNRLIVFHPRKIGYFTGTAEANFTYNRAYDGVGCLFSTSPATANGVSVWMSEQGIMEDRGDGPRYISRPIQSDLQGILDAEYNSSLYVSSCWSPALRQFIFLISAISTSGVPWIESGSGVPVTWKDSTTGAQVEWQDSDSPGSEEAVRVAFFGYSPETQLWTRYKFGQISDLNTSSAYATFVHTPLPSSDTIDPQQSTTYFGYFNGTEGKVVGFNKRGMARDDSDNVVAKFITGRIVPGEQDGSFKRIRSVEFAGAYADPTTDGTLQYLADFDDPHLRSYPDNLKSFTANGDHQVPTEGKMRFMHLYGEDSSTEQDKIMLSDFTIHFHERAGRQSR